MSSEIILTDSGSNTVEYIEITNSALGTVDGAGDMIVIGENNPCIPNINPPYVAENTANKRDNLINPNSITYTSTLAVASAISGLTTGYTFTESGITVITQNGNNINIYVPADAITGVTWNMVTDKPDLVLMATFTGYTGTTAIDIADRLLTTIFTGYTGITAQEIADRLLITDFNSFAVVTTQDIADRLLINTFNQYVDTTNQTLQNIQIDIDGLNIDINNRLLITTFNDYSGATAIDINSRLLTTTFSGYTGTTDNRINGIEQDIIYLSGETDNRLLISTFSGYTGNTAPSTYATINNLTAHTSNLLIHYEQSGITITESQVTQLPNDLLSLQNQIDNLSQLQSTSIYYVEPLPSDIGGYESLLSTPQTISGSTDVIVISGNTVIFDAYATIPNQPSISEIPSGLWVFHGHFQFSAVDGLNYIHWDSYRRESGGTEYFLFRTSTPDITTTGVTEYQIETVQSGFTGWTSTDRLVIKIYAQTTGSGKTVTMLYGGTSEFGFIQPPIVTNSSPQWSSITLKPSWLTGNTLSAFESGHAHSQYLESSAFNVYSGTTVPNNYYNKSQINSYTGTTVPTTYLSKSSFSTYSGTTVPNNYYNKTEINIYTGTTAPSTYYNKTQINTYTGTTVPSNYYNKSQINFYTGTTAPNTYTQTGTTALLRQNFDSHSGNSLIHFYQSAITITESQVTNLVTDLANLQTDIDNLSSLQSIGVYYIDHVNSDIGGYESLLLSPLTITGNTETISISGNTGLIDAYITPPNQPAITSIPSGLWVMHGHFQFSAVDGLNYIHWDVYRRTTGGSETFLFRMSTPDITTTASTEYQVETVQLASTGWTTTDRLVVKIYAQTTGGAKTVSMIYGSTTNFGFLESPLIVNSSPLWSSVQAKPSWLSGNTLSAFEAQHAHPGIYPPLSAYQTYTGTTAPATYAPKPIYTTAVLTVAGWTGATKQQYVTVSGVTPSNRITVYPPTSRAEYLAYGTAVISAIAQATNRLTFEASTVPIIQLTANIVITP